MQALPSDSNALINVYRQEAFDSGLVQYFQSVENNRISQILNNKERNIKLSSVTHRQLNSWDGEGLLTVERDGRQWRKFSIVDAVWVKIIKELREFGMSREHVKNVKVSLEYRSKEYKVSMPFLEFYLAFAIGNKLPVLLLVFKDGAAVPCSFTQYKVAKELHKLENHIQIDLNSILQEMFPEVDLKPAAKTDNWLQVDEMELLAFLRIGDYEKVEIFYKNGKMQTVEGMQRLEVSALLNEVIQDHSYQKIEMVIDGGKKVSLRRVVKKQINKKG